MAGVVGRPIEQVSHAFLGPARLLLLYRFEHCAVIFEEVRRAVVTQGHLIANLKDGSNQKTDTDHDDIVRCLEGCLVELEVCLYESR